MFEFINRMHQKPERTRRMFALSVSAVTTLFIFVVWVTVRVPGVSGNLAQGTDQSEVSTSSFGQNMAGVFSGLQNAFGGFKEKIKSVTVEAVEEYESKTVNTYVASTSEIAPL